MIAMQEHKKNWSLNLSLKSWGWKNKLRRRAPHESCKRESNKKLSVGVKFTVNRVKMQGLGKLVSGRRAQGTNGASVW